MRVDKLLWYLRIARTRAAGHSLAQAGHMRLNGRRIDKAHQRIATGDVLTIPTPRGARVIELLSLPQRRGPASEAQSCYRVLDETTGYPIAAANCNEATKGDLQI